MEIFHTRWHVRVQLATYGCVLDKIVRAIRKQWRMDHHLKELGQVANLTLAWAQSTHEHP